MLSTPEEILAHLREKEMQQRNPNPDDLRRLCEYVKASSLRRTAGATNAVASVKNEGKHPFCAKAEDAARETATYLLYLFSYNRAGIIETWMTSLEKAVATCDECARGFCVARRTFIAKYVSRRATAFELTFDLTPQIYQQVPRGRSA
jgi:senataxin